MKKFSLTDISLIGVAIVWALNFSVIKTALQEIDPYSFNALRYLLAGILLVSTAKLRGFTIMVKREHFWKLLGIGIIGNLVYQMLFIIGLNLTFSANAAVMLGTIPIWVALLSQLFTDEKLNRNQVIGITLAFVGVTKIITGGSNNLSFASETFIGDLIALMAAISWAIYTILSKKYLKYYNSTQYSAFMSVIGIITLGAVGLPFLVKVDFTQVSAIGYGGLLYSGLLSVGIAYLIWNHGIIKIGAVRTAMYQNLVPVLGVIFGVFILDEALTILQYIGSGFVILGLVLTRK
ncbi:MAG: DMT family transporter [Balneola sp.]|nr:MAG: DMT family transporter [Balneola sp.]